MANPKKIYNTKLVYKCKEGHHHKTYDAAQKCKDKRKNRY